MIDVMVETFSTSLLAIHLLSVEISVELSRNTTVVVRTDHDAGGAAIVELDLSVHSR